MLFPFWELNFILINMPNKLVSPDIVFISSNSLQRGEEAVEFSPVVGIPVRSCCWVRVYMGSSWPPVHFFQNPPGRLSHGLRQSAGEDFKFWPWIWNHRGNKRKDSDSCDKPMHLQCDSPAENLFSLVSFFVFELDTTEKAADSWADAPRAERRKAAPVHFGGRELPLNRCF